MNVPMNLASRLARAGFRLLGWIPLPLLHALAHVPATLMRWANGREAQVARRIFELCFPAATDAERAAMLRRCLHHTGCTLLETCRLWTQPIARSLQWVVDVEGVEHLDAALANGRGAIVAAPHLGNWELLNQYLTTRGALSIVYRRPQTAAIEPLLLHGRGGAQVNQLPAEPASVRGMLKALKSGGILGLLPDQQPKVGEGEYAPFFGIPALTMTLLPRLARSAGAAVVFGFAERLPQGRGFRVRFLPAPAGIDAADPQVALHALNAGVEACIAHAPDQYQWTYKRYSRRPPGGGPNPYLRGHAGHDETS